MCHIWRFYVTFEFTIFAFDRGKMCSLKAVNQHFKIFCASVWHLNIIKYFARDLGNGWSAISSTIISHLELLFSTSSSNMKKHQTMITVWYSWCILNKWCFSCHIIQKVIGSNGGDFLRVKMDSQLETSKSLLI